VTVRAWNNFFLTLLKKATAKKRLGVFSNNVQKLLDNAADRYLTDLDKPKRTKKDYGYIKKKQYFCSEIYIKPYAKFAYVTEKSYLCGAKQKTV